MNYKKLDKIKKDIIQGKDDNFCYSHFDKSNMADYTLMSSTIEDMVYCYNIDEVEASNLVNDLTH